jgi:putative Ca2+/H+ antiporter (TMEM165/GDT1 family)
VLYLRLAGRVRSSVPARKFAVDPLIALAVFPIIFIGELSDKTMFASLVMATRGRPRQVWLGAAGAFVLHVTIAVTVGLAIFAVLLHRAVEGFVAVCSSSGPPTNGVRESRTKKKSSRRRLPATGWS